MGVFKINGTDILELAEVINNTDPRGKSVAFSSGKLNVTGLSNLNKTLANANVAAYPNWGLVNIVGNKLKVGGTPDTVSAKGCRPLLTKNNCDFGNYDATYTRDLTSYSGAHPVFFLQLFGGGGGGGGGGVYFWGGASAGQGGGGAGAALCLINLNTMPGNSITIGLGAGGAAGAGQSDGGNGGLSYINDGLGNRLLTCNGGKGGGGGTSSSSGGTGKGQGGTVTAIAATSYFRLILSQTGGLGGSKDQAGAGVASANVTIPMDGYTVATTATQGGARGDSGGTNTRGGGGAGCGSYMENGISIGGAGGSDRANGSNSPNTACGGGGGGAHATGSGCTGGTGGRGLFLIYW